MNGQDIAVAGVGVMLPDAGDLAQLYTQATKDAPRCGAVRRFDQPHTDLPEVQALVGLCPGPDPGATDRRLPRESQLATAAARQALAGAGSRPDGAVVATAWATSTAGMAEYGQVCVEAATLPPGLASPLAGPQAAYNGPAAAVSIQLRLTGPQLVLVGGPDAGASLLFEAGRMLAEGQCDQVLCGGSATVDRWRLAGARSALVPAEGAACLLLGRPGQAGPGILARPLRRGHLGPSGVDDFVSWCLAARPRPPDLVVLSAAPSWRSPVEASLAGRARFWYLEEITGELGAAGGLHAVVAAVAGCTTAGAEPRRALVIALGRHGQAVAVDVSS